MELPNQFPLRQLEERIRVLEDEQVELINVPVPEFDDGDPADIVHDFQRVRPSSAPRLTSKTLSRFLSELIMSRGIYCDINTAS